MVKAAYCKEVNAGPHRPKSPKLLQLLFLMITRFFMKKEYWSISFNFGKEEIFVCTIRYV